MNKRNSEGYSDPTAYAALSKIEKEEAHVAKLRGAIAQIFDLAGFRILGKIYLVNKRDGTVWK